MNKIIIQIRENNSGKIVAEGKVDSEKPLCFRRQFAEDLCKKVSDTRDCYAVELEESSPESKLREYKLTVLNKYELCP